MLVTILIAISLLFLLLLGIAALLLSGKSHQESSSERPDDRDE